MASHLTHEFNGVAYYTASGIGACELALYHSRTGQEPLDPPENILKAYAEGNDNEQTIIELLEAQVVFRRVTPDVLEAEGWRFGGYNEERGVDYSEQVHVEVKIGNGIIVGAHPDGIVVLWAMPLGGKFKMERGGRAVLEVKAFGDSLWKIYKSKGLAGFPKYQWQISVQMLGTGLLGLFVVGHKGSDGRVFEIDYEEVMLPPISRGQIAAKLLRVEKAVATGDMSKIGCPANYDYPCPYYQLHEASDQKNYVFGSLSSGVEQPEAVEETNSIREIDSLAGDYNQIREQEGILKARKEGIRDSILALFDKKNKEGDTKIPRFVGSKFVVTDVTTERKGGLKEGEMVKDGIDVEKYRSEGSVSRSVRVTERKGEDGE